MTKIFHQFLKKMNCLIIFLKVMHKQTCLVTINCAVFLFCRNEKVASKKLDHPKSLSNKK